MQTVVTVVQNADHKLDTPTSPTTPTTASQQPENSTIARHSVRIHNPVLIPSIESDHYGKIVIFDTAINDFYCRAGSVGSASTPFMPSHRISIPKFATKIDLGEAGVQVGEGQVEELVRNLPKRVVWLRLWGWYRELYVVRHSVEVEGSKDDDEESGGNCEAVVEGEDTRGANGTNAGEGVKKSEVKPWDCGAAEMGRKSSESERDEREQRDDVTA